MSDHEKMPHFFAKELGDRIIEQLMTDFERAKQPLIQRAELLGSIRRNEPMVGDIEILIEPIREPEATDLFGDVQRWDTPLYHRIHRLKKAGMFQDRISKSGQAADGDRYKRLWAVTSHWDTRGDLPDMGERPDNVAVDLFICIPPSQWGVSSIIRTGPYLYSQWFVTSRMWGGALPRGWRVRDNCLVTNTGEVLETPEETDVYDALGLEYVPPEQRKEWWNVNVRAADAAGGAQ